MMPAVHSRRPSLLPALAFLALAVLPAAHGQEKSKADQILEQAIAAMKAGDWARMEKLADEGIALRVEGGHVFSGYKGIAALNLGRPADAESALKQAVLVDPEWVGAWDYLGKAQRLQGKLDAAIASGRRAVSLDPKSASAHENLGVACSDKGLDDEAIKSFEKVLELVPTATDSAVNLGYHYNKAKRYDDAVRVLSNLVSQVPGHAVAQYQLGNAHFYKHDYKAAIPCYERAIKARPDLAVAMEMLAWSHRDLGDMENAIRSFESLLKLQPGNKLALAELESLRSAKAKPPADATVTLDPASAEPPPPETPEPTPVDDTEPLVDPPPETPWTGRVQVTVPAGPLVAGEPLRVAFRADTAPPSLRLAVFEKGKPAAEGSWSEAFVGGRAAGVVDLRVPAVPGEYEVRACPNQDAAAPPAGVSAVFTVVLEKKDESRGAPMEPLSAPWIPPRPVRTPPEPPLTTVRLPDGAPEPLARAIADFHQRWLSARPPEPGRSLQIEIAAPPVSFNLGLSFTGDDGKSPLAVELALKLNRERAGRILKGGPVTEADCGDLGKGMFLHRLTYPAAEATTAASVLAMLMVESHGLGHPAAKRSGKKRAADAKPPVAGTPPWKTNRWWDGWPLPVERDEVPEGVREYHGELEAYPLKSGTLNVPPEFDLRFDWSESDGLDVTWIRCNPQPGILFEVGAEDYLVNPETRERIPAGTWKEPLPTLNGRPQTNQARPKRDASTGDHFYLGSRIVWNLKMSLVDHHVVVTSKGAELRATYERYVQVVAETDPDKHDPLKDPEWNAVNGPRRLRHKAEVVATFDPAASSFTGTWVLTDYTSEESGKRQEWKFTSPVVEYGKEVLKEGDTKPAPVEIVEVVVPKGLVRAGEEIELKVRIRSTEKRETAESQTRPFDLFILDGETRGDVSETVSGSLSPGETAERAFKIIPPQIDVDWRLRAVLKSHDVEATKDFAVPVGTFPVHVLDSRLFNTRLDATGAASIAVTIGNVRPADQKNDPKAAGTGTWGIFDHQAQSYPVFEPFRLGPAEAVAAVRTVPAPKVEGGVTAWKLSVVILNEKRELVSSRALPPIRVDAPLDSAQAGTPAPPVGRASSPAQDAAASEEARFSWMDGLNLNSCTDGIANRQRELERVVKELARLEKSAADNESLLDAVSSSGDDWSKIRESADAKRKRIAELKKLRDGMFGEMDGFLRERAGYFDRRLREVPEGSPLARSLRAIRDSVISNAKLSQIQALGARGNLGSLRDIAVTRAKDDPVMRAEAFKQMAGLYYQKGMRSEALASLLKADQARPGDERTLDLRRRMEAATLAGISGRIEGEIQTLQGTMSSELGSHGEAGMWGYTYDTLSLGGGTLADRVRAWWSGWKDEEGNYDAAINNLQQFVSSAENEGRVQQVGIRFMSKMIESGLTLEQVSQLEVKHLLAARAVAACECRTPEEALAVIGRKLAAGPSAGEKKELERMQQHLGKLSGADATTFRGLYPGLKSMMDAGGKIPDRAIAVTFVSVKAALANPDVKKILTGSKQVLAADLPEGAGQSYLGVEEVQLSGSESAKRFVLDMPNMMTVLTMAPAAQTAGGVTVAEHIAGAVGRASPKMLEALQGAAQLRKEMTGFEKLAFDFAASTAAEQGATYATGDPKFGFLIGNIAGGIGNLLDAEGMARKMVTQEIAPAAVSNLAGGMRKSLQAFESPDFAMGDALRSLDGQLAKGFGTTAAETIEAAAGRMRGALKGGDLGDFLGGIRQRQADLLEDMLKRVRSGDMAGARGLLPQLRLFQQGADEAAAGLRREAEKLARVIQHMEAAGPPGAAAKRLEQETTKLLGRKPAALWEPLNDAEVDLLLREPERVRELLAAGVLTHTQEGQLAAKATERFLIARQEAMKDLFNIGGGRYARLFDHFRDTGSWPAGKSFRDIDFTPKLAHSPDPKLLREIYSDTLPGLKAMSDADLLSHYRQDADLKRRVLLMFEERLGRKLGMMHKRGGDPKAILEEYRVAVNEIPGVATGSGARQMSHEEYRLHAGFARSEGTTDRNVTRVLFDKTGSMKLRTGYRVDDVRLPGDVPVKFEVKHAYAKVYDEMMMFNDHFHADVSDWDNIAEVYKYSGRIHNDLALLARAPDAQLGLNAGQIRQAYEGLGQNPRFAALFAEGKAIKEGAKTMGYPEAVKKALGGRLERFRTQFPAATEKQLQAMAAAEYFKDTQAYFLEMRNLTRQIQGCRSVMSPSHSVGAKFHEYLNQNPGQLSHMPPP